MFKVGKYTTIRSIDDPHCGNANHLYDVVRNGDNTVLCIFEFQDGAIRESGVNGVMNEDLISIIIDRLQAFQTSEFKCRENTIAITKLEEALMWLEKRTQDRIDRGVEGTHQV